MNALAGPVLKPMKTDRDFPGGPVVKNPPVNAGDTGLILVQEDFTCPRVTRPVCCNY